MAITINFDIEPEFSFSAKELKELVFKFISENFRYIENGYGDKYFDEWLIENKV